MMDDQEQTVQGLAGDIEMRMHYAAALAQLAYKAIDNIDECYYPDMVHDIGLACEVIHNLANGSAIDLFDIKYRIPNEPLMKPKAVA